MMPATETPSAAPIAAATEAAASTPPPSEAAVTAQPTPAPAAPAAPVEKAVEPQAEAPVTTPSLLGEAGETPAPAPAKEGEPAPAPKEVALAEPTPPSFQPFDLPDGVSVEPERMGQFSETLGKSLFDIEAAKDPDARALAQQTLGQKLVDFHVTEVQRLIDRMGQASEDTWHGMRRQWQEQTKTELGTRFPTAMKEAGSVIEQYGGTKEQQRELRLVLDNTGAGDHPALVRLFANVGRSLGQEGTPVPAERAPLAPKSRADRRYPKDNGARPSTR